MKKFLLASAIAVSALSAVSATQAREFNNQTLDYRNIKDGPDSPIVTTDPKYPVTAYIGRYNLIIENTTNKPVEVNGWRFDVAGCDDVDLPKGGFRLPPNSYFIAPVGHCNANSMRWAWLNVGNKTKKFKL